MVDRFETGRQAIDRQLKELLPLDNKRPTFREYMAWYEKEGEWPIVQLGALRGR